MYAVGQKINIGYYGGFRNNEFIKTEAVIIEVSPYGIVEIRTKGHKRMFGYEKELKELENNFYNSIDKDNSK